MSLSKFYGRGNKTKVSLISFIIILVEGGKGSGLLNNEANNSYMKRLKASIEALKLAGEGNVLVSPDLVIKTSTVPTI